MATLDEEAGAIEEGPIEAESEYEVVRWPVTWGGASILIFAAGFRRSWECF